MPPPAEAGGIYARLKQGLWGIITLLEGMGKCEWPNHSADVVPRYCSANNRENPVEAGEALELGSTLCKIKKHLCQQFD